MIRLHLQVELEKIRYNYDEELKYIINVKYNLYTEFNTLK